QATTRDSQQSTMSEQASASAGRGTAGRHYTYSIIGNNHLQMRIAGSRQSQTQTAVNISAAPMASSIPYGFLDCREEQFGNRRRHHLINTLCCLFRDMPANFIKRLLEIMLNHGLNSAHQSITLQTMRRPCRCGTHHSRQS